jgi:hypothetical protein
MLEKGMKSKKTADVKIDARPYLARTAKMRVTYYG